MAAADPQGHHGRGTGRYAPGGRRSSRSLGARRVGDISPCSSALL